MKRRIAVKHYNRRFRQPLRTARGIWSEREGFLVRVEQDGAVGYGEVAPLPEFGSETLVQAATFLRSLEMDPERTVPGALPCCAFALSAARRTEPAGRSYSVGALIPAGSRGLELSAGKIAAGYRSLKWKIGVKPVREELALARQLLGTLPSGCRVRLDANGALSRAELSQWLAVLMEFPEKVDYIEQPLPPGDEPAMADFMEASAVEIALDESLNGAGGCRWMEPGVWSGPLVIKAALMGDVDQLAARLKPVAGQIVLSSVFETRIGLESSLRVADAIPGVVRPVGFDTVDAFDDELNPMVSGATICEAARRAYSPETIWNLI